MSNIQTGQECQTKCRSDSSFISSQKYRKVKKRKKMQLGETHEGSRTWPAVSIPLPSSLPIKTVNKVLSKGNPGYMCRCFCMHWHLHIHHYVHFIFMSAVNITCIFKETLILELKGQEVASAVHNLCKYFTIFVDPPPSCQDLPCYSKLGFSLVEWTKVGIAAELGRLHGSPVIWTNFH